jgi:serine/threonine-protein kinase
MMCVLCGADHAADRPCPNVVQPDRTGTQALARELASAVSESITRAPGTGEDEQDPLIGTTLGSFRIVRRLGKGGMGTVYLGEQTVIGSKVAVKILHSHLAANPDLVARFYAEARAVNLIGHENIVSIFDMNVVPPDRYYLIMEYLDGRPLSSLLRAPMEAGVAIPILTQVCDALQAAHSHGVVHRDLKPENIFLLKRGRNERFAKILDFGIAKLYGQDLRRTQTAAGMLVGTPEYMAPEQCNGEAVDGRADLYALGVISYLMATGRLPFQGGGLTSLLLAHREQIPPAPHDLDSKIPVAWSTVIMQALAKRPQDRYQDAGEMREALERALGSTSPRPTGSQPRAELPTPPPGSKDLAGTPAPSDSRHIAAFIARVLSPDGQEQSRLHCVDVSRGGLFLCADGPLPPVFSRVKLQFELPDSTLACEAEVVRHVSPEQARAWNMQPGFGVQFVNTTAAFRDQIARAVQGLPVGRPPPPPRGEDDDPAAEPLLEYYRKRINGDHYVVLAMMQDAEVSDLRSRAREARRELESLRARPLSRKQDAQVQTALDRLQAAMEVLGHPARRAEYDARRGNFKGVARAISAGLTVSELESLRALHLSSHPGHETRAQVHFSTGNAWEGDESKTQALEEYEHALALDPLNLRFHQRYWALKRKVMGTRR